MKTKDKKYLTWDELKYRLEHPTLWEKSQHHLADYLI